MYSKVISILEILKKCFVSNKLSSKESQYFVIFSMAERSDPEVSKSPDTHRPEGVGVNHEESVADDKGDISLTGNGLKDYLHSGL